MDKYQSFCFSHYKMITEPTREQSYTTDWKIKQATFRVEHKNTQKENPSFLSILSAFWWRVYVSWYLKDREEVCQVEGRRIYKEHTQRVRNNTCGIASSRRWRGARAKQQSRVNVSDRESLKNLARTKLIWVFLFHVRSLEFYPRAKGKSMRKSMTEDLNVTCQVTAIWTIIA